MTKQERIARLSLPKTLLCANCDQLFPRGSLSATKRNFCKPECRVEWTEKNRKPRPGFTDDDAERIWNARFAQQESEYYSGFVYRPRYSSVYGAAEIGGANRRRIDPRV